MTSEVDTNGYNDKRKLKKGKAMTSEEYLNGFHERGKMIINQIINGPRPESDKVRRLLHHAIARLGSGQQIQQALDDISWANEEETRDGMFFTHANIDVYLRFSHLYPDELKEKVFKRLTEYEYNLESGTENHKLMFAVSGYLVGQTWSEWDKASYTKKKCENYLNQYFNRVCRYGQGEFDSTTYSVLYLNTLATLFDFTQDTQMRKKAGMMLDWYLVNTAGDWLNGCFTGAHSRDYLPLAGTESPAGGVVAAWLYFGGKKPNLETNEPHYCVINYLSSYQMPTIIARIATDRSIPFEHLETHDVIDIDLPTHDNNRTKVIEGSGGRLKGLGYISRTGVRKYTYMTKDFALASMIDGKQGDIIWSGQLRRWSLDWESDEPNNVFFFTHPFPDFGHEKDEYYKLWRGSSPYEQVLQHKGTIIAIYNIPPNTVYKYEPRNPFPSDKDPYIEGFFPGEAVLKLVEDSSGWIFCHGGAILFAVRPFKPYEWVEKKGVDGCIHNRLRSNGLKNGVIVEVVSSDEYKGQFKGVDRDEQISWELEHFMRDILEKTKLCELELDSPEPFVKYKTIKGENLSIRYDGDRIINDSKVDEVQWPLIANPFIRSDVGSGLLYLNYKNESLTLDYNNWSESIKTTLVY